MNPALGKVLGFHQAFWNFDPWYRRAWIAAPQAAALAGIVLIFAGGGAPPPPAAPWVKPVAQSGPAPASADNTLCMNVFADAKQRGEACDRLIKAGQLTGIQLGQAYAGRAWMHQMANQADPAIADYTEAVKHNPTNFAAYISRGYLYMGKNDLAAAEQDFEKALANTPGGANALALAYRAEVRRKQGRLAEAQADVTRALEIDKDNKVAQMIRDGVQADLRRPSSGSTQTAPVTQSGSVQASADFRLCMNWSADLNQRGEACDRLIGAGQLTGGQLAGAYIGRAFMRQRANQFDAAIADYSEALKLSPTNSAAFVSRGAVYLEKNDLANAERDFDKAIETAPGNSNASAFAYRAEVRRRQGRLAEAQADVAKALDIQKDLAVAQRIRDSIQADVRRVGETKPSSSQAPPAAQPDDDATARLRASARASLEKKDYGAAINAFTFVILGGSRDPNDYYGRGFAYLANRQFDLAMEDFSRSISLPGHTWHPHAKRAEIHAQRGELDQALSDLNAAIGDHRATEAIVFWQRGLAHMRKRAYNPALQDFDKFIELEPNYAPAYVLRGQAHAAETRGLIEYCRNRQNGPSGGGGPIIAGGGGPCARPISFNRALEDFRTALDKKPDFAEAHDEIGRIMWSLNRWEEAAQSFSNAIRAKPDVSGFYNNRGVAYLKLNRRDLALEDFNTAIRLDPQNREAHNNRSDLLSSRQRR